MPKDIHRDVEEEVFEDIEKELKRMIEKILDIPISIGVPDARWKKQYGYPMGVVMISSGDIIDWIEDGNPESEKEDGNKIIQEFAIAEADLILSFHLATRKRTVMHRLSYKFLKTIRETPYINEEDKYKIDKVSFRNVPPDPEGERVFEKIFSLSVTGTLTETVITQT